MWAADQGPGCADVPGVSHLKDIDPLLWVGNEIAAAHGKYEVVVSTVVPRDWQGRRAPQMSTHAVHFADGQGSETRQGIAFAKSCIEQGAAHVKSAIEAGKTVLVHCVSAAGAQLQLFRQDFAARAAAAAVQGVCGCDVCRRATPSVRAQAWGQNRSCAICCAYAVLHRGMSAQDAIRYMRERNLAERSYAGQQPPGGAMHNRVFREIIGELERERDARGACEPASDRDCGSVGAGGV